MTARPTIAVLGAGSWGTALGILLARNGFPTRIWGHDGAHVRTLEQARENKLFLPGIVFPEKLTVAADLAAIASQTREYVVAVPSHAFRAVLEALASAQSHPARLVSATKGFEPGSGKLLGEVAKEIFEEDTALAVVSGPTFAREVAQNLPSALTVAAADGPTAEWVADWLRNERMRVYTSLDLAGVQLGGAIKNVMAIAAGISDGLGFGANARAALITRGLAELTRLGVAMGGRKETFMGLTGAGDLILTCTDNTSRNRRVGLGLGQGKKLAAVLSDVGQEAEGVATARELYNLARRLGVDMPITQQVYRVLYEHVSPQAAVEALLKREPRREEN